MGELKRSGDEQSHRSLMRSQNNISVLKNSLMDKPGKGKTSSMVTIFAIVNIMVGSVVLLLPVNYQNSGLIFSTVAMLLIALINWKTISWIVIVSKGKPDLQKTLQKYIGVFDYRLFAFSAFSIVYGVGVVYFSLLNTTLYKILQTIFAFSNFTNYGAKDEITFNKWSMQWQSLIVFVVMFPLLFFKELKFLIQLGRVGACSIYAYIILIIYLFIDNCATGTLSKSIDEVKLFTPNIAFILGNFALAFCVHNCISEMMSTNKNQEKNVRDSKIVYAIACFIYGSIGILGSFALLGRKTSVENPSDIFDFFADDLKNIPILIVALVFFVHLVTVYPLLCFLSKNSLFNLIYEDREVPKYVQPLFNTIYALLGLIIVIFHIDPNIVVGFIGTVFGFVLVYFIPIRLRINQKDILEHDYLNNDTTIGVSRVERGDYERVKNNVQETLLEDQQNNYKKKNLVNQLKELSMGLKIGFIVLLLIGVGLTVIQFLQLFGVL